MGVSLCAIEGCEQYTIFQGVSISRRYELPTDRNNSDLESSSIWCRLVFRALWRAPACCQTISLAILKISRTTDVLLITSHELQSSPASGHEGWVVQLNLLAELIVSTAVEVEEHLDWWVGAVHCHTVLRWHTHRVGLDGCFNNWHQVHSAVPQGSVLGPMLFNIYTTNLFRTMRNSLYGYVDDVTLIATIQSPQTRH